MSENLNLSDAEKAVVLALRASEAKKPEQAEKVDLDDIKPSMSPETKRRALAAILALWK
jgi:hypothetical protein